MVVIPTALQRILENIRRPGSIAGQVGMTATANLVIAACSVFTGLLTARLLGPEGRGELAAIQSWSLLLASLAMIGMPEAIIYWGSRDFDRLGAYIASAFAIITACSAAFVGLGWFLMPWLLSAQTSEVVDASRVFLVIMAAAYMMGMLPQHVLRIMGNWRLWNTLRIVPGLCWLATLLTLLVLTARPNAVEMSRLYLLAFVAATLPMFWLVWRRCSGPYRVQRGLLRPLLRYGVPSALQVLPRTLNLRLDQMVMASLLEPRLLGIYAVAVAWSGAATPLLSAVGPVLFPRLSAVSDAGEQRQVLRQVLPPLVGASSLLTLLLLAITPFVLPLLFGADYAAAIPAALVLVSATVVSNLNLTLGDALRGLGRPREALIGDAAGLVVIAIALALLLRPAGILGAAIASLLAYGTTCIYLAMALRRRLGQS